MKPGKKGEMYSSVIKYMLMAFFSLVVLVAGFQGVTFIRDRACNAELAKFELELSGIDKELRFGVKELKDFRIPCKTSQIYFFDTGKKINPNDFDNLPLMKNALATNSSKNVFVIDKGRVKKSFYAGNMEAIYPYYLCLKPKFDRISFFAEGKENSAFLTAACGQPDCTLIPINISESEAQRIIQEAVYSQFGCDRCRYDYALENIKSTKEKVELFRRFIVCNGITKVEIIIKPQKGAEVTNFRYYEYIPKECIDDLSSYLQNLELDDKVIVQKNDPLIVWHFDEIEEETILSYELSKEFGESCKRIIEGLGVVQTIQRTVPPVPVCGDDSCNGLETCSTCSIDCPCQIAQLPQPIIPPASQPAPTPTIPAQCPGGIPLGCDPVIQPRKCVALGNGQYGFVNDCRTCNCPSGWNCEGNGNCGAPATSNQCSDGTLRGECSDNKPLECRSNLVLSRNAGRCGCPSGYRQQDNNCVPDSQTQPTQPQPSPTCAPKARKDCVGKSIYWFDSCNQRGDFIFNCRDNTGYGGTWVAAADDCKNGECCESTLGRIWDDTCCNPGCQRGDDKECVDSSSFKQCGNFDSDGCLEWSNPQQCGPRMECRQSDGQCVQASSSPPTSPTTGEEGRKASLSVSGQIDGSQSISGDRRRYQWSATISESNGVGVNINSFEGCLETSPCQTHSVSFNVPGGGSVQRSSSFDTTSPNKFTIKYSGTDANGNTVETNKLELPI